MEPPEHLSNPSHSLESLINETLLAQSCLYLYKKQRHVSVIEAHCLVTNGDSIGQIAHWTRDISNNPSQQNGQHQTHLSANCPVPSSYILLKCADDILRMVKPSDSSLHAPAPNLTRCNLGNLSESLYIRSIIVLTFASWVHWDFSISLPVPTSLGRGS